MMPRITSCCGGLIYSFPDENSCIPPHTHDVISHYAYVLHGEFLIKCSDGEYIAKKGNFIDFPIGENHSIHPLGRAAVFNRFHPPCGDDQLDSLIGSDLQNLRGLL